MAATRKSDIIDITAQNSRGRGRAGWFRSHPFRSRWTPARAPGVPARSGRSKNLVEVGAAFGTESEAYLAATAHFGQETNPKEFKTCRWAQALVSTVLTGGRAPSAASVIGAISNASFRIGEVDVSGVDLSSAGTYSAQATAIQTAIRALATAAPNDARFANATVEFANGRFVITLPSGGDISGALEPHSQGTGTDISGRLGHGRRFQPDLCGRFASRDGWRGPDESSPAFPVSTSWPLPSSLTAPKPC